MTVEFIYDHRTRRANGVWRSLAGITLCVFLAIAALLLVLEHGAHILGVWPLLFLLICGGMHFFMHRGHGGHGNHNGHDGRSR